MVIPGFSAYDISEDGVVTHIASNRVLRPHKVTTNTYYTYIRVSLVGDDEKLHTCSLLRLLALAFIEKPPVPCMARAKDGNNLNVTLQNVEWVPYHANVSAAWENGSYSNRKPKKSYCCTSESMELVLNTLEQLDSPITTAELSRMLDISYSTARYTLKALMQHGKVKSIHRKGFVML